MKRDLYKNLLSWKKQENRKSLILKGARQVGKTYLLKEFGEKEYKDVAYFNFEEDPGLSLFFERRIQPKRIIEQLSFYSGIDILKNENLIFMDEIQQCPRALTSLKYFAEFSNEYHIVSAGSMLGLKLGNRSPFPVGKVDFLDLYPFSFVEFLEGIGKEKYRQILAEKDNFESLNENFHNELIYLLKLFYYIGGMPEAILQYKKNGSFNDIRYIQNNILISFAQDFSKYSSKSESVKITATWNAIPSQLARENKKFKYSEIFKNARSRDYYESIQWLLDAGFIYKSNNVKVPKLPLKGYAENNIFKLYILDVGLLSAMLNLPQRVVAMPGKLFTEFNGAFTENYVAQEMIVSDIFKNMYQKELYYWSSKSSAEVDFIVQYKDQIFPLEVKAGVSRRKTSLKIYGEKFKPIILSRTNLLNYQKQDYLCNYPLYAIGSFPALFY